MATDITFASQLSTVVANDKRRNTVVNLKHVYELPLRNALQSFDKNGDGKIDIAELQRVMYWYGLWKYASVGLCLVIMVMVWSTFGLTVWAINLTKDYSVTGGVMTNREEVVKMSVASTMIPLSWASLLDRRHLDGLESITVDVTLGSGKFASGEYHMKVASYLHANSTYLKLFGVDGSRVWVNSGTVVLHHPDAEEAVMLCGAAACNTLAVDVKPEYLQQLVQRGSALLATSQDFELPTTVDGVSINKAAGDTATCQAYRKYIDNAHSVAYLNGNSYDKQSLLLNTPAEQRERMPERSAPAIEDIRSRSDGLKGEGASSDNAWWSWQDTKDLKKKAEDTRLNQASVNHKVGPAARSRTVRDRRDPRVQTRPELNAAITSENGLQQLNLKNDFYGAVDAFGDTSKTMLVNFGDKAKDDAMKAVAAAAAKKRKDIEEDMKRHGFPHHQ